MEHSCMARFTVSIISVDNATWQGTVEMDGERYYFSSEMDLLKYLLKRYPSLRPSTET